MAGIAKLAGTGPCWRVVPTHSMMFRPRVPQSFCPLRVVAIGSQVTAHALLHPLMPLPFLKPWYSSVVLLPAWKPSLFFLPYSFLAAESSCSPITFSSAGACIFPPRGTPSILKSLPSTACFGRQGFPLLHRRSGHWEPSLHAFNAAFAQSCAFHCNCVG